MARFVCFNFSFFQLLLIICSSHSQGKVRVLLGYFMHLLSEAEGREATSRLCFIHFDLESWFPGKETDYCRTQCSPSGQRQLGQFSISPFGHTELTTMISLSYHQTIASQCAIPHNGQSNLLESVDGVLQF